MYPEKIKGVRTTRYILRLIVSLLIITGSSYAIYGGPVTGVQAGSFLPMLQAQQPSVVEQNRVVSPKDAVNGAEWLKSQGVQHGLDQLDLGADSKGHPIKFEISKDGQGVQIKLTGSGLDNNLAADKTGGGIMGKFKKKNNDAKGASGLTITDLLGPKFTAYDPENKSSMEEKSVGHGFGSLAKLNELAGGGKDHYLKGKNLYPSDLRTIEQNAPVVKLLAEGKSEEANKLYSSMHVSAEDADLGTSDPAKIALIQKLNVTMDNLTAQEQAGAKTLHFKAESGNVIAYLDDQQTANMDKVLQSMSPDRLFETGQATYTKDANGKGVVTIGNSISSQDIDRISGPLKVALDTGDAKKVEAYQKYKGLNDLNLPKRSSIDSYGLSLRVFYRRKQTGVSVSRAQLERPCFTRTRDRGMNQLGGEMKCSDTRDSIHFFMRDDVESVQGTGRYV